MDEHIETRLRKILADALDGTIPADAFHPDTSLYGQGLGLDSVDVVALIVRLEAEFDVFFEADEVAQSVETFGVLLGTLERKLGGGRLTTDGE